MEENSISYSKKTGQEMFMKGLDDIRRQTMEINFMRVTNDIEKTFCRSCTKYKTQNDSLQTEKEDIIKTQNTFKHLNQLQPNIEH